MKYIVKVDPQSGEDRAKVLKFVEEEVKYATILDERDANGHIVIEVGSEADKSVLKSALKKVAKGAISESIQQSDRVHLTSLGWWKSRAGAMTEEWTNDDKPGHKILLKDDSSDPTYIINNKTVHKGPLYGETFRKLLANTVGESTLATKVLESVKKLPVHASPVNEAASTALTLLNEVYKKDKKVIDAAIIKTANEFLAKGLDVDSEQANAMLFDDGAFEPFLNAPSSQKYSDHVEENGNDDDEADRIGEIWINVLSTNKNKYLDIIDKFEDIRENGL